MSDASGGPLHFEVRGHRADELRPAERLAVDLHHEAAQERRLREEARHQRQRVQVELERGLGEGAEIPLQRVRARLWQPRLEPLDEAREAADVRFEHQLVLVREVVVEHAVGNPGRACELARRQSRRGPLREQALGRSEQVLAQVAALGDGRSPPRHIVSRRS